MNQDLDLSSGRKQIGIGLQLWTMRNLAGRDMHGTLRSVAALGYSAVEFAGFAGMDAPTIRHTLNECGMKAVSAHVPFVALSNALAGVIVDLHGIGCARAVVPAFSRDLYRTPDDAARLADMLNTIASRLRAEGIAFAYHNETDDFLPLGGSTLWHMLVAHTDPALVDAQLDVFTAIQMGHDPSALMRVCPERICSIHVCDMRDGRYVPVGQGTLDWSALIAAARHTACEWLIVEHDDPPNPIDDAATSLHALTDLLAMRNA